MNVTEFLLARIGEDEAAAGKLAGVAHSAKTQVYTGKEWVTTPISTERVLAECAAKRAIIAGVIPERDPQTGNPDYDPLWVIRELVAVYKDHPDYDPAWSPNGG